MPLTRSQSQAPDVPDDRSPPPADSADDAAAGATRPRRSEGLGSSQQPDAGVERLLDTVTQRMDAWEARLTTQAGEMEALRRELRRLVPAEPSTGQVPLGVPAAAVYGSAVAGPAVVAANGVLGAGASSPQCSLDVVELPTFDGTISWDAYRIQLDGIAAARGWDEQMKAWMLVAKLRGRATELLQNVPPDQLGSYTVLAGLLADHYGASGQPRVQYHHLRARRQEPGETYQDLAAAIERLALQSLPGAPQNAVALVGTEAFVDAIRLPEVTYLGHVVSRHGIRPDPEKLKALTAYEAPTTAKELKSFLGFASYFRRFIPDFAKHSAPLTALLKKNAPWSWTQAQQLAFLDVKHALLEPPTSAHYDESAPIVLHTDASQDGLGAVLLQEDESGDHKVLAYASRQLSDVERRRHSSELECLAVVWAVEKFRPYLYGRHFTIVTDNSALTWLQSAKHLNAKIARWSLQLQEYNFTIVHRRGSAHQDADFLSRHPCSVTALTDLRTAQTQDPAIAAIIHSLGTAASAGLRQLRRVYRMKDDLLCHVKRLRGRPPVWLPVVPATLRSQILRGLHDAPTDGHLGRGKT
ncbi:hypothetical protein V5799_031518 [Amblyomma americanum]|uniref:Reverse transcriptase RNase H-like domain-containing protein n=1 Tax=Amblyomma americanum TaxID=6943 RepID=A0AAQ4EK57_AMBAM